MFYFVQNRAVLPQFGTKGLYDLFMESASVMECISVMVSEIWNHDETR